MSALAGTISASFAVGSGGIAAGRWLRTIFSLLLAAGVLAIALPAAFGGGARAGVDPVRVFSSGPALVTETSGSARLSIEGMVPGQSRTATIRVSNAGSGAEIVSLTTFLTDRVRPGGVPLSEAMTLRISPLGPAAPAIYQGTLAGMSRLSLGQIPAGGERTYRFTVALPGSVGNEVKGSSLSAGFVWDASS